MHFFWIMFTIQEAIIYVRQLVRLFRGSSINSCSQEMNLQQMIKINDSHHSLSYSVWSAQQRAFHDYLLSY